MHLHPLDSNKEENLQNKRISYITVSENKYVFIINLSLISI